jgi:hypothetical protein
MTHNSRPKRAFIAYCVLAERLSTPGVGAMQALIPFLAEACQDFSGQAFDAEKFSKAVAERYDIRIPRLAALGLAEQLSKEGLLTKISDHKNATVYQYAQGSRLKDSTTSPVTEAEVENILRLFVEYCRPDIKLNHLDDNYLYSAFLDRLLNVDSMRILSRREASVSAKKSAETLGLKRQNTEKNEIDQLHLDFIVSQFLIDLRDNNPPRFEQVSNVAFANMAAEAIACFREPSEETVVLSSLTVYLDSPLLLDMLGVNSEYEDYGRELLAAIKTSGAVPAVFEHAVAEAEAAVSALLSYLRSGVNHLSVNWGLSTKPDILAALSGNVAERAEKRLGITVQRDPDTQLHRRSQATVGDIESDMIKRMQAWRNEDAKEHDRKSVWAMLEISDSTQPSTRICDSKWLLLTRNTSLVRIANDAWKTWLKGSTRISNSQLEKCAPVAMSDKQFSGYLWARTGGGNGTISRARLLAHCSSAVRPRADVKARAYNLVLEHNGREAADDFAALIEDREGVKALMRATKGDPEDVTSERLPYIFEKVKLAAGEFAATKVRDEKDKELEEAGQEHKKIKDGLEAKLLQEQLDNDSLGLRNKSLQSQLEQQEAAKVELKNEILDSAFVKASGFYSLCLRLIVVVYVVLLLILTLLPQEYRIESVILTVLLGVVGFWVVPDKLFKPVLNKLAMQKYISEITVRDKNIPLPTEIPDFSIHKVAKILINN